MIMKPEEIPDQILIYTVIKNSAVILRCFSHEDTAWIPAVLDGIPVRGAGAYCFSSRMDRDHLAKTARETGLRTACTGAGSAMLEKISGQMQESVSTEKDPGGLQFLSGEKDLPGGLQLLAGDRLQGVILQDGVESVGRYCFYECSMLQEITFPASLTDWGSGVFTGCHRIRRLTVIAEEAEQTRLKDVLDELSETVSVRFMSRSGSLYASLVFPGFFEEGVENTPARILETHVHGSGLLYRNCFRSRVYDFREYDRQFPYAVAREDLSVTERIAEGRLRCPHQLTDEARDSYEAFFVRMRVEIGNACIEDEDLPCLRLLAELCERRMASEPEALAAWFAGMIRAAGEKGRAGMISFLMEHQRRLTASSGAHPSGRRRFEL